MSNDILPLNQEKIDQIFKELNNQNNTLLNFDPCDCLWDNNDANRSTGRTTRLTDYYIQELFNNPNSTIEIIDHHNTQQANIHLTQMILKRMDLEHPCIKLKIMSSNSLKYEVCNKCGKPHGKCRTCEKDIEQYIKENDLEYV